MSADPGGPEPTAHSIEHIELDDDGLAADGLPVGRRQFMKVFGAAAATAAAGSAATGTVAADDDEFEEGEQTYDPEGDVPIASSSVGSYKGPDLDIEEETSTPDADETILHSMAVSARESYQMHHNVFENHLSDMDTIASLEARDELARAWEDGDSPSDTYIERVLPRIRTYFTDPHEKNHLEAVNLAFAQFAEIHEVARADDDVNDDFLAFFVEDDNDDEDFDYATIGFDDDDEFDETDIELHNGDEHTLEKTPVLHIYTESGDGEAHTPLTTEILESWDDDDERFEIQADDESHTWSTSLNVNVQSVGDPDDDGLRSQVVFWGRDLADLLEEIEDQSDRVTGNYDEDLVEQFFDEMDAGNLDPSDVRGAEGNARFLAGNGDLSDDAFRMALLQQFNLQQSDLSEVASTTITYTGYTERAYGEFDDDRIGPLFDSFEDGRQMEGFFQAREIPDDGLETGSRIVANPMLYSFDRNGYFVAHDADLEKRWQVQSDSSGTSMAVSWHRNAAYFGQQNGPVTAIDLSDGSEIFDESIGDDVEGIAYDDGTVFAGDSNGDLRALDAEDGSEIWDFDLSDGGTIQFVYAIDGEETILVGDLDDDLYSVDVSDDSPQINWQESFSSGVRGAASDGETIYVAADDAYALDAEDGSEIWSTSISDGYSAALSPDESLALFGDGNGTAYLIDTDDGEVQWEFDDIENNVAAAFFGSAGEVAYVGEASGGSMMYAIDVDSGSSIGDFEADTSVTAFAAYQPEDVDGAAEGPVIYDAPEGEEVGLTNGVITIDEMTDSDGNEIEDYDPENWGSPEYNTNDSEDFATYLEETFEFRIEEYWAEEDDEDDDSGWGLPSFGDVGFGGESLFGLAIIGGVVMLVIGFVTDLLPWT